MGRAANEAFWGSGDGIGFGSNEGGEVMDDTVESLFAKEKLTREDVEEIAEESTYWASASKFILDHWGESMPWLTSRQRDWLDRILEDMTERRINKQRR